MGNLLKFELRRLFRNKSFYICMVISLVLILLNASLGKTIADATGLAMAPQSYYIKFIGNGMLTMVLGIFIAIFDSEDFVGGTIKNIYAKGYSRNDVYMARFITSVIATLVMSLVTLIGSVVFAELLYKGEDTGSFPVLPLLVQMLIMIAYNSLYYMITTISGKMGTSVAFNIVGPSIIGLVLSLLDSFLKLDKVTVSSYWLDNCLSNIQTADCSGKNMVTALVSAVIVIAVTIIIGAKIHEKKEV